MKRTYALCLCGMALAVSLSACGTELKESSQQATAAAEAATSKTASLGEDGLGTKFTYELLQAPQYDSSKLDLTPNSYSVIDTNSEHVVYNGVQYNFDTASGATPRYVRELNEKEVDQTEKDKRMFWTVQPPLGVIKGEFYRAVKDFAGGYIATTDLVIEDGKVVHIEMNERGPKDYYEEHWADQTKRRSGYGFFQAQSPRTHETLMVTPNAFNYLEWQVLKYNSLNFTAQGVRGISNSAREAFIPELKELAEKIVEPSSQYYTAISLPLEQGVIGRLELIHNGADIAEVRYDEIFADMQKDIANDAYKPYYRQSKLESVEYNVSNDAVFRKLNDALAQAIIEANSLDVNLDEYKDMPEYKNARMLMNKLKPVVAEYRAHGAKHEIGKLLEEPQGLKAIAPIYYRTENLHVKSQHISYNPESKTLTIQALVKNEADEAVDVLSDWFFLYVKNARKRPESIGDPQKFSTHLEAKSEAILNFNFYPVYEDDTELNFKYDGPNKSYEELKDLKKYTK